MAELAQLPRPVMCRSARLHSDHGRRQLGKKRQHLAAPQLPAQHRPLGGINPMQLKNMLRRIHSNSDNLVHGRLPCLRLQQPHSGTLDAVGGRPHHHAAVTAEAMGIEASREDSIKVAPPRQPGEWLEHSPILTVLLVLLAIGWVVNEFSRQDWMIAISSLNTYNFMFIMIGLLLHWRPKRFLAAVVKSVPAISGVLIQFPFYGAIAAILTQAKNGAGVTVSDQITHAFVSMSTQHLYPLVIGIYSAVLGFFIPSGGGKWLLEAPYVMQAATDLKVHLGWAVQVYNAAEALPNLINPFWMLPLLGVLGLRARDVVGFTFLQLLLHLPVVLFLLWALAYTLEYHPPVMP